MCNKKAAPHHYLGCESGGGMNVRQAQQWMRWYALGLCITSCGLVLGHTLFTRLFVVVLYESSTETFLDGIITGQYIHPIEHYYRGMDQSILNLVSFLCLLSWVLFGGSLSSSTRFVIVLLSTDMIFIILGYSYGSIVGWDNSDFSIGKDGGHAETFQYLKEFGMLVFFFLFLLRYRYLINLGWQTLLVYIFVDDSLRIHERVGKVIAQHCSIVSMTGLQAQDFGELIVSTFFGLLILSLLSIGYYYADSGFRSISRHLVGLFSILVSIGVIFDMVHPLLDPSYQNIIFEVLEEGGEMLTISVMAWYVHRLTTAPDPTSLYGASGVIARKFTGTVEHKPNS